MDSAAECVGETHTDSLFRFLCSIHPGATRFLCVCLEPSERNVRLELSGVLLASIRSSCRYCFLTFVGPSAILHSAKDTISTERLLLPDSTHTWLLDVSKMLLDQRRAWEMEEKKESNY